MDNGEKTFDSTRPWLFWLREYLHRACEHHGCNPIFQDFGRPSSEETLRTLERREIPSFKHAYLGTFYPHMMFQAIKGYICHQNWDDAPQNILLKPIYERFGPWSNERLPGKLDPVAIDYSAGIERAQKELKALFLFNADRYDDAVATLFLTEHKKTPRDIIFDIPRAVGIWLFDRTVNLVELQPTNKEGVFINLAHGKKMEPVGVANAIKELQSNYDMKTLWLDKKEPTDFHFYLNKTIECIEKEQVLPFTRRKSKNKD